MNAEARFMLVPQPPEENRSITVLTIQTSEDVLKESPCGTSGALRLALSRLLLATVPDGHTLFGSYFVCHVPYLRDLKAVFAEHGIQYITRRRLTRRLISFAVTRPTQISALLKESWWEDELSLWVGQGALRDQPVPRMGKFLLIIDYPSKWYLGNLHRFYALIRIGTKFVGATIYTATSNVPSVKRRLASVGLVERTEAAL